MTKVIEIRTQGNDDELGVSLDDLAREGAKRMVLTALEAEVEDYIARYQERTTSARPRASRSW